MPHQMLTCVAGTQKQRAVHENTVTAPRSSESKIDVKLNDMENGLRDDLTNRQPELERIPDLFHDLVFERTGMPVIHMAGGFRGAFQQGRASPELPVCGHRISQTLLACVRVHAYTSRHQHVGSWGPGTMLQQHAGGCVHALWRPHP